MKQFLAISLCLLLAGNVYAQDGFGDFDLGTGSEEEIDVSDVDTSANEGGFYGFIREELGYSPNKEELNWAKMRTTLNLTYDLGLGGDWKMRLNGNAFYDHAYSYNGEDHYSDETLEAYQSEAEARDVYLEGPLASWLQVKAGRQIIAWGQSEVAQINDLANPRDLRELGMIDIEDARIQVGAVKWAVMMGDVEWNLVTIHEFRPNKIPAEGSEFDFLAPMRSQATLLEAEDPEAKTEVLSRLFIPFNGGDLAFYWGNVYQDQFVLAFESFNGATQEVTLKPVYEEIQSYGMAANRVWGSWLIRLEAAKKTGVPVQRNDLQEQIMSNITGIIPPADYIYDSSTGLAETYVKKDMVQGAMGVEFSGWSDWTFSLEGSMDRILDYQENLQTKETTGVGTAIVSHQAFNDTLTTRAIWFHFSDENGDLYRMGTDYALMDGVNVGGGVVIYQEKKEDGLLYPFKDNDRVYLTGKFNF